PVPDAVVADGGEPDAGPPPVMLDLVKYVDPFIGTDDSDSPHPVPNGAGGNMYPAAVAPFGMVQIGPDTPTADAGGYRHRDGIIKQFSATHIDGAGCSNDQDFPFMPVAGAWSASPGTHWSDFRTAYDKNSEAASPGFYHAKLATGIDVEVSAT